MGHEWGTTLSTPNYAVPMRLHHFARSLPPAVRALADPALAPPAASRHVPAASPRVGAGPPSRSNRTRRARGQRSSTAAARRASRSSWMAPTVPSNAGPGRSGGRCRARNIAWRWAGEQYSGAAGPRRDGTTVSDPHQRHTIVRVPRPTPIYRTLYPPRHLAASMGTPHPRQPRRPAPRGRRSRPRAPHGRPSPEKAQGPRGGRHVATRAITGHHGRLSWETGRLRLDEPLGDAPHVARCRQ